MSVLVALATQLETALVLPASSVWTNDLPDESADPAVALFLTGAAPPEHDLGQATLRLEFPQVQAIVRGSVHTTTLARMKAVVDALVAIRNTTLSGVYYLGVDCESGPALFKRDANLRWLFTANFSVMKVPS